MRAPSVLVAVLLIVTFPIWIGIAGGLFGLIIGLIGGAIGIVAGVFGAIFGVIGALIGGIFEMIFGWGDWDGPHFHFNTFGFAVVLIIVALIVRARQK